MRSREFLLKECLENWKSSFSLAFRVLSWEVFSSGGLSYTYPWSFSSMVVCSLSSPPFNPFYVSFYICFLVFACFSCFSWWLNAFLVHGYLCWAYFLFLWVGFILYLHFSLSRCMPYTTNISLSYQVVEACLRSWKTILSLRTWFNLEGLQNMKVISQRLLQWNHLEKNF